MGKASRWLKSLLGMKRDKQNQANQNDKVRDKRRWSFTTDNSSSAPRLRRYSLNIPVATAVDSPWLQDENNAIAVAAEAAAAAAHAAMAAVRLTAQVQIRSRDRFAAAAAALYIQTVFRGFLARKALRALKGVVKLQAHVRGFLVRKRAAATLHSMQAIIRAQASARLHRSIAHHLPSDTHPTMSLEKKYEETRSEFHSKRVSSVTYDEEDTPKIVEIDTYKPGSCTTPSVRPNNNYYYYATSEYDGDDDINPIPISGPLSYPVLPVPTHYNNLRHRRSTTAHSTPRVPHNMTWTDGPFTPAKSVCGDGPFRPHRLSGSYHPNYMASTQSFEAKSRSQSVPKQRPPHPSPSKKGLPLDKLMECRHGITSVRMNRSFSEDTQPQHLPF